MEDTMIELHESIYRFLDMFFPDGVKANIKINNTDFKRINISIFSLKDTSNLVSKKAILNPRYCGFEPYHVNFISRCRLIEQFIKMYHPIYSVVVKCDRNYFKNVKEYEYRKLCVDLWDDPVKTITNFNLKLQKQTTIDEAFINHADSCIKTLLRFQAPFLISNRRFSAICSENLYKKRLGFFTGGLSISASAYDKVRKMLTDRMELSKRVMLTDSKQPALKIYF